MFSAFTRPLSAISRKYDELWLPDENLPKTLDDFRTTIDTIRRRQTNERVFITDVNSYPDQYLYALKALLRTANEEILVFTDRLEKTLSDGTPLYSDHEIIDILTSFLHRVGTRVTIIARRLLTSDFIKAHPLFMKLINLDGFTLYFATNRRVRKCESKCVIVDNRAYNFRVKGYAWINFNDPEFATKLSGAIKKAVMLPSAHKFEAKLLEGSIPP